MGHFLKSSTLLICACLLLTGGNAFGEKLFQWTDTYGTVHFPKHIPAERLHTERDSSAYHLVKVHTAIRTRLPVPESHKGPIRHALRGTFTIKGERNLGTAFFISSTGYAVTCRHVIEDGNGHTAVLNDNTEYPIGVIATSDRYDLALILVLSSKKSTPLSVRDVSSLALNERVYAIGSSIEQQYTVTNGIFTGLRERKDTGDRAIQFSAPINPGSSGGPVIDSKGRVIGAISWKIVSKKGMPVTGAGFAIPSSYVIEEFGKYME